MKQKPIRLKDFIGINNVLEPEQTELRELQVATNVYVNDAGRLRRRDGRQRVYSGSVHSLFSDGFSVFFREGTSLKRLNADNTATDLRTGIVGSRPVRYLSEHNRIYYTDGITTGIIEDGVDRSWGMEIPKNPMLTETVGDLRPGRYHVATTFVREDKQESGSGVASVIDISTGGIVISNIGVSTDPAVNAVDIYVTEPNSEILWRAGTVQNGTTSITVRTPVKTTFPLLTQHMVPPPPGHLLAHHNGRIYIAYDNIVWYTEHHRPELINLDDNFIPMEKRVTFLAGVNDGIWIGTQDRIVFIQGDPPQIDKHNYMIKAKYGCIENTQIAVEGEKLGGEEPIAGMAWIITTEEGIHIATEGGFLKNVTEGRVKFPYSPMGTAMIRSVDDAVLYTVGLYSTSAADLNLALFNIQGTGADGFVGDMSSRSATGSSSAVDPTVNIT